MSRPLKSTIATWLVLLVTGCDSEDEARELRNRVTVAAEEFNVAEIRASNDVLEKGSTSALEFLVGKGVPTVEKTALARWSSSDPGVASVSDNGQVTAVADGPVTISADFGSLTDRAEFRVSSAPLTGISVLAPETMNECDSVQLNATGLFPADEANERTVTDSVSWVVSNTPRTVGVFSPVTAGLFRSSNNGTAVITASRGEISGQASIMIANNLQRLTLTPVAPVITTGSATQFSVAAGYSDVADTPDVTDNASWSVVQTSVASVDNSLPDKGRLNAFSNSDVTLRVTCGGVQISAMLEVGNPSIVESISFGREDNPFEFDYPGQELTVTLRAIATLQTQEEVSITEQVDWITVTRNTDLLVLSNDSGSKGQLTVRGRGSITVRIEYDVDEFDEFDETNSTFNSPTLTINVL